MHSIYPLILFIMSLSEVSGAEWVSFVWKSQMTHQPPPFM